MLRYMHTFSLAHLNDVSHFVGNGDIMSFEDANLHREQTGVSGLMVAR